MPNVAGRERVNLTYKDIADRIPLSFRGERKEAFKQALNVHLKKYLLLDGNAFSRYFLSKYAREIFPVYKDTLAPSEKDVVFAWADIIRYGGENRHIQFTLYSTFLLDGDLEDHDVLVFKTVYDYAEDEAEIYIVDID